MMSFLLVSLFVIVLCSSTEGYKKESDETASKNSTILLSELYDAIRHGDAIKVRSLIDRGVHVNRPFSGATGVAGSYPLHIAVGLHSRHDFNAEIFNLLIKNGANLEVEGLAVRTPLFRAIEFGNTKAVKLLLENGANPNAFNEKLKMSPLHAAFHCNYYQTCSEEILNLLIQYGADVNQTNSDGETPLHQAIYGEHKKAIEMLIERGANVNAQDAYKTTPLHFIAMIDQRHMHKNWTIDDSLRYAELLVSHGAKVNAKDRYNKTAYDLAFWPNLKEFLRSKTT